MSQCSRVKIGMHPWIFSGNGQAAVNFMSSSQMDISTKNKDTGVWIAFNKWMFVNTDEDGIAVFD